MCTCVCTCNSVACKVCYHVLGVIFPMPHDGGCELNKDHCHWVLENMPSCHFSGGDPCGDVGGPGAGTTCFLRPTPRHPDTTSGCHVTRPDVGPAQTGRRGTGTTPRPGTRRHGGESSYDTLRSCVSIYTAAACGSGCGDPFEHIWKQPRNNYSIYIYRYVGCRSRCRTPLPYIWKRPFTQVGIHVTDVSRV